MAPLGNPITWIPYGNSKDCSQGFCSTYCPQWCYIVYPPPPPPPFEYPNDDSTPKLSPLVVAIIGILVTAFLLVSYYTIISKYCGHRESAHRENPNPNDELQDNHNHQQPLHVSISTTGLDESLIKSIAVYKYKKGDDFFVGLTDCSVCLNEFQNGESVRLLPKCSHAFHLPCIDTWLKSHSSCPLCRSSIFTFNSSTQAPVIEIELPSRNETSSENQHVDVGSGGNEFEVVQEVSMRYGRGDPIAKPTLRAFSDLSNFQGRHRVIEIRDEVYESIRSVSMDHSFRSGVSVADVLNMNQEEDSHSQAEGCYMDDGTSKRSGGESSKSRYKRRVLHCVMSPIAMKKSFSSGRFSFRKIDRERLGISPV